MNKTIDTFDNMTTDEMCPQLLEMVTQLQKENKKLKEETEKLNWDMDGWMQDQECLVKTRDGWMVAEGTLCPRESEELQKENKELKEETEKLKQEVEEERRTFKGAMNYVDQVNKKFAKADGLVNQHAYDKIKDLERELEYYKSRYGDSDQ